MISMNNSQEKLRQILLRLQDTKPEKSWSSTVALYSSSFQQLIL